MYKVIKKFRDKDSNELYNPGDNYSTSNEQEEKKLLRAGYITKQNQELETASMPDNTEKKADIKHLGGGWYEVNGQKVQGREQAEKLLREGG